MNREIKFKGKSISTGKWLYGCLLKNEEGKFAVVKPFKVNMDNECSCCEVDEETIGQFTGLKDKNGKEIYEGDILTSERKVIGWVQGGVRGYCYDVVYIDHPQGEKRWSLYGTVVNDYPGKLEVIGNIYDNRELLEK